MPTEAESFWTLHLAEGLDYCYFEGELQQSFTIPEFWDTEWELLHWTPKTHEAWYAQRAKVAG